jgi:hypothetical protein
MRQSENKESIKLKEKNRDSGDKDNERGAAAAQEEEEGTDKSKKDIPRGLPWRGEGPRPAGGRTGHCPGTRGRRPGLFVLEGGWRQR